MFPGALNFSHISGMWPDKMCILGRPGQIVNFGLDC